MIPITHSYPEVAAEWHPTKNTLSPEEVSAGMTKKVWWLCPNTCPQGCLHEWEAYVGNRCRLNYGCPFCSKLTKRVCIHTSIVGTHPEVSIQWHPTKNGDRGPDQYSYGSEKKAWWLCPNTCSEGCPHEWEADISKRILRGADAGCPYCASNHRRTCIHTSIVHTHPHLAAQWHPTKNGELKPETLTHGSCVKVWWLCPNTCDYGCKHEWEARVSDRLSRDTGCPQCCGFLHKLCIHQSISYTHPEIIEEWHPTKNGDLTPDLFSYGSEKRIWWQCKKHVTHVWRTSINNRCSNGTTECPQCMNKTEEKLFNYVSERYTDVVRQFTLESCKRIYLLRFDICITKRKIIIEMDGQQHFRQISNWLHPEETLRRDVYKMRQAEREGYKVIRVCQEDIYKATDDWLEKNIITEIENIDRNHMFISENEDLYNKHIELYSSNEDVNLLE